MRNIFPPLPASQRRGSRVPGGPRTETFLLKHRRYPGRLCHAAAEPPGRRSGWGMNSAEGPPWAGAGPREVATWWLTQDLCLPPASASCVSLSKFLKLPVL